MTPARRRELEVLADLARKVDAAADALADAVLAEADTSTPLTVLKARRAALKRAERLIPRASRGEIMAMKGNP